jgi:hypothetical protein
MLSNTPLRAGSDQPNSKAAQQTGQSISVMMEIGDDGRDNAEQPQILEKIHRTENE